MEARGTENVSNAIQPADASSAQISQHINNPSLGIENQLHGVADIASARNFFVPKVDIQPIVSSLSGLENTASAAGAAAAKAASGAISPMIQLIMRMPGHLGLFNSFLDVLKSLFMPHDLLSSLNPSVFVPGIDLTHIGGLSNISQSLAHPHAFDLSMLSSSTHAFSNMGGDFLSTAGTPHLHINAADSLKQSANVSAGVDVNNPQFEGISGTTHQASGMSGQFARGDNLAGPSLSAQAITPKLAPAQRIFSNKLFESGNGNSSSNTFLASNTPNANAGITSNTTSVPQANVGTPQAGMSAESINKAMPAGEQATASSTSGGLHAKALSLNDVLHKHLPQMTLHKQTAGNPFSQLASSTKQAFQAGKSHIASSNHDVISHTRANNIASAGSEHNSGTGQYTVKPGDSLWKISENVLGSGDRWSQLYKFNTDTIGANPNMIYSGQKLALSGIDSSHVPQQLAHHAPSHINQVEHQVAHVQPTAQHHIEHQVAHAQPAPHLEHQVAHSQPAAQHLERQVAHVQPSTTPTGSSHASAPQIAHNSQNATVSHSAHENVVAHAPIQSANNHGLAVNNEPEHVLNGSGGAQAANVHTTINKTIAPATNAPQSKSVVSFSLTPDLSFLDNK